MRGDESYQKFLSRKINLSCLEFEKLLCWLWGRWIRAERGGRQVGQLGGPCYSLVSKDNEDRSVFQTLLTVEVGAFACEMVICFSWISYSCTVTWKRFIINTLHAFSSHHGSAQVGITMRPASIVTMLFLFSACYWVLKNYFDRMNFPQ